jgi:hypothetical protein
MPQQEKGLGAHQEMMWKSRWTGIQHTLAIYDRIINISGHQALRDAVIDGCSFRSWFVFCLTLTVTLPKPGIIMPFWDIIIDKFAAQWMTINKDGNGTEITPEQWNVTSLQDAIECLRMMTQHSMLHSIFSSTDGAQRIRCSKEVSEATRAANYNYLLEQQDKPLLRGQL